MSDGFLAVRAEAAGANPTAEGLTLGTALLAKVTGLAERALVDDVRARDASWHDGHVVDLSVTAAAEGSLPTGIRTPTLAATWMKGASTNRARGRFGHRYGVVTRRGSRAGLAPRSWAGGELGDVHCMESPGGLYREVKP